MVVDVHVEHHRAQTQTLQMVQARRGQRAAQAGAPSAVRHGQHIHLSGALVRVTLAAVHLGPVEAGQSLVVEGQQETPRVEPGLGQAFGQVVGGPRTLVGQIGEGLPR